MDYSDQTVIKPRPGKTAKPQSAEPLSDQTIITPRPRPSNSKGHGPVSPSLQDATVITPRINIPPRQGMIFSQHDDLPYLGGSKLLTAASPILALAPQLRQITGSIDINALHNHIKHCIQSFENKASSLCDDRQLCTHASYILCALIDETVLNTPWGEHSHWSQSPMLSIFHQETYGGEKVYDLLSQGLQTPARYEDILEIIYRALSLGFMGKLRVDPQGPIKIEQLRSQIYEVLTRSHDHLELLLSPQCQPIGGLANRLHSFLPFWILSALLVLLGFGIYNYWLFQLNGLSDNTRHLLSTVVPHTDPSTLVTDQTPIEILALRELLADEIARDYIQIDDYTTHTAITLKDREMFPSGSESINAAFLPILVKVAKALESIPGQVVVTGHTDDRAIRTAKFPSNWHLSLARASEIVKQMDAVAALDSRLLPEGRGAEQPITANNTAEGRAQNRRVVIDIYYTRQHPWNS